MRSRFVRMIDVDTGRILEERYFRGHVIHRDPHEGPAIVVRDMDSGAIRYVEYKFNDRLHRDGGPAVVYPQVGKLPRHEGYYQFGLPHRDPTEGPAILTRARALDEFSEEQYWWKGSAHRDRNDGPAFIVRHYRTGVILREEYWEHGERVPAPERRLAGLRPSPGDQETNWSEYGRDPSPSNRLSEHWLIEEMDLETGRMTRTIYQCAFGGGYLVHRWRKSHAHRDPAEGPAITERDWRTGIETRVEYRVRRKLHRESGPARIVRDRLSSHVIFEGHYRDGLPHRDPSEGPAIVRRDATSGEIIGEEFWIRGEQVAAPDRPATTTKRRAPKPSPR
jgi:hypothetical protein